MIDFISTHPSAEQQTVACARLLTAIIAQAIEDASNKKSTTADNYNAINWLFNKSSTFTRYAELIGGDAEKIRRALLALPSENEQKNNYFDASKRRYLRASYSKWLEKKKIEQKILRNNITHGQ